MVSGATEVDVYRAYGLSYIEPELREGRDEIELAERGALPTLVRAADIRGELHAHSTSSDGSNTIDQMAEAARQRGYEYLGISDHSQSLKIAGGLSEDDLWAQIRYIDRLNERMGGIRILKSAEVDILADGSLDYSAALLQELDYTICSIHSRFGLGKEQQTSRILRAMDNPHFSILGHATGRLLLKRPGYELDIRRVIAQAARSFGGERPSGTAGGREDRGDDGCPQHARLRLCSIRDRSGAAGGIRKRRGVELSFMGAAQGSVEAIAL
jgi:DNA polymerase (family 10)